MKIAILGSRGIPNAYGGFEQYAELLSQFLSRKGCEVHVYCSSAHPYQEKKLGEVHLRHQYDPEHKIGTIGQFVYDYNCIMDARRENFDIIYQLGYTSSAIFNWLMPRNATLVTNMDGFEWQRSKYNRWTQQFLKWSEAIVVKHSDFLIADALPIKEYLQQQYNVKAQYSAYTTVLPDQFNETQLREYNLTQKEYTLLIARMEPENNIEPIIQAYISSELPYPLIILGNADNTFGKYLQKKYNTPRVRFIGAIYDKPILDALRYYSYLYFHGHSVGGTNPSLLEAMACSCHIIAHNNKFNKSVLDRNALYFSSTDDLQKSLSEVPHQQLFFEKAATNNRIRIREKYTEEAVFEPLYQLFQSIIAK